MKKKLIAAITTTALVLGIGSVALANSDSEIFENFSFKDMLPFMQKMHPDMQEDELKQMYESCHGENGIMNGPRGQGMMQGLMNGENPEGLKKQMRIFMNEQGGTGL